MALSVVTGAWKAITGMLRVAVAMLAVVPNAPVASSEDTEIPELLASAQAHARTAGELLWPGYGSAPFGMLLIDADSEWLYCQSAPAGFVVGTQDPATGCTVASRARTRLPDSLLAAMPIFGTPSTIVVGTPAATGRRPAAWLRTLLHEHFHQWQAALPDYYKRVDALDLKKGDETGMWMLNFPVPYDDDRAGAAHAQASRLLLAALEARGRPNFRTAVRRYRSARLAFAEALGPESWRYVEFQLWQEGVARWTEIELGRSHPDPNIRASAVELEREVRSALASPSLSSQKRLFAYPYGAGEAMVLERCSQGWRERYPTLLELGSLIARC